MGGWVVGRVTKGRYGTLRNLVGARLGGGGPCASTCGSQVSISSWVGGQLGGVWLAGWGWFGGLRSLTQSLAGRGPGEGGVGPVKGCEKFEKCENVKNITTTLVLQGFANNYEKNHGFYFGFIRFWQSAPSSTS